MDLRKKYNLTVSASAGIKVEYLAGDLVTVDSTLVIPTGELSTIMFDPYSKESPVAVTATEGMIMIDRTWYPNQEKWKLPFCNIVNYNGSALGVTTFATIMAAIIAIVVPDENYYEGLAFGKYGSTLVTGTGANTGTWFAIHALADAVFNAVTDATMTGSLAGVTLTAKDTIYGNFTAFTLTSGTVIAYKK
jgi:hypothetical protein